MISWETCSQDFWSDGSLRDIYVTPASLADWRAIYPLLQGYPAVEFSVDGIFKPLPSSVDEVFALRPSGTPMLRFRVGRTLVVFHFFSMEAIECDVSPQEITSPVDLEALLAFVRQLGEVTQKRVAITPENLPERPFITYDPNSREFEHH